MYRLEVKKEGFSTYLQTNLILAVGQSATINPTLQLGAVTQTVEVTESATMLATGTADLGSEVSTKQAVELPLNIRNVYGLVGLDSSVNNSQQNQALNPPGSQGNVDQESIAKQRGHHHDSDIRRHADLLVRICAATN